MVFVQGAEVKSARNAKELMALFEEGSKGRHVASHSEFENLYPSNLRELYYWFKVFVAINFLKLTLNLIFYFVMV